MSKLMAIINAILAVGKIFDFLTKAWDEAQRRWVEAKHAKKKKKRDEITRQIEVETEREVKDVQKIKDLHRRLRDIER